MLRRPSVRTRLIAVLAVPLVLLLAVGLPELIERRTSARDADRAASLTRAGAQLATTIEDIQAERTASASVRAGGGPQTVAAMRDHRAVSDTTIEAAQLAVARIASVAPDLEDAALAVSDELRGFGEVREETDLAASIVPWVDPFAPALEAMLQLQEDLGSSVADAGMGSGLTEVALLARAKDAAGAQAAQLEASAVWGELRGDQVRALTALRADEQAFRTAYLATAPPTERIERRTAVAAGAATTAGRVVDAVVREGDIEPLDDLTAWRELAAGRQAVLRQVEGEQAAAVLRTVEAAGAEARRASVGYLAAAGGGLVVALGLALLAARSITRPLRRLTVAADDLAERRLPQLVDALRHPSDEDERYLTAGMQPVEVQSDDELGHLAKAFNAVQSVAVEVAAEQSDLLRKGISDLYVNLARRNQALIERQIQLLDRLEGGEQDPEVLEHLFLLDHLATRMRRNAESLLVLAGAESGPRRSRPVAAIDAVRAALSEVEAYDRVEIGSLPDATLHGPAVTDVAHILAELIENATTFSPPDSMVRVDGSLSAGGYQLVVTDRGIGIDRKQMEEMNAVLHAPPVTGLALGRALGCLVAGRLAARHGITVRLRPGDPCGVVAQVVLPRSLLVDDVPRPVSADADGAATTTAMAQDATDAADPWLDGWPEPQPVAATGVDVPAMSVPATLRETIPSAPRFDAGLLALLEGAAQPGGAEAPAALADAPNEPRPTPHPAAAVERPWPRRSPDEVRALLSRYRSGLQAGRDRGSATEEDRP